jgi:5-methylcytosine-specific restriction endonuclease McrA
MPGVQSFMFCLPEVDQAALKRARAVARAARKQRWWLEKRDRGICHYCSGTFPPKTLTMDHIVPLARGGTTTPGNVVAACQSCNQNKSVLTPVDAIFQALADERQNQLP